MSSDTILSCPTCRYPLQSNVKVCSECGCPLKLQFVPVRRAISIRWAAVFFACSVLLASLHILFLNRMAYEDYLVKYNLMVGRAALRNGAALQEYYDFVAGTTSERPNPTQYPGVPLVTPAQLPMHQLVLHSRGLTILTVAHLGCLTIAIGQFFIRRARCLWAVLVSAALSVQFIFLGVGLGLFSVV